jgi:hypothetical protein
MTRVRDLEQSLRKILSEQLLELVRRSAPEAESTDRDAIAALLDQMITDWIRAGPNSRQEVLKLWRNKIAARIALGKDVRAARGQ